MESAARRSEDGLTGEVEMASGKGDGKGGGGKKKKKGKKSKMDVVMDDLCTCVDELDWTGLPSCLPMR